MSKKINTYNQKPKTIDTIYTHTSNLDNLKTTNNIYILKYVLKNMRIRDG